ncbi:hypothetical protein E2562_021079 [Oryza meyeriana var. granulata]|uniref:Uncharacterized protein n=1 Tax=Oryza meyeriana var. granulata TaxID=110450 RepID=A0A6G1BNR7_9ORYZ|nr:hypothetical protein E2562_021079 [Oryza meyeriana var. granulata]
MQDLFFLFMTSARDPGIVPRNTRAPPEADELLGSTTPSMEWSTGRTPRMRFRRAKDVSINGFTVKVKFCETCQGTAHQDPHIAPSATTASRSLITTVHGSASALDLYHYGKDNPYRKSIAANFVEVFFTKIPPPQNSFRSWVGEGALEAGFYTPYIVLDLTSPREKIEVEVGNKEVLIGGMQIPTVLQNIDYGSFEDNPDDKNRNEDDRLVPFASTWAQQRNESAGTSAIATGEYRDKISEDDDKEIISSNTSSAQTSREASAASEDESNEDDAGKSSSSDRSYAQNLGDVN